MNSLKKAVDDRMLKTVNKNNKSSYRIIQETHLNEDCVIHSQIGETLENTDGVKHLPIRLDKTSDDDLTNLANEFRLLKANMQQQKQVYGNISYRFKKTHIYQKALLIWTLFYYHTSRSIQYRMGW